MMRILVAGGFDEAMPGTEEFAKRLGEEVIEAGHVLLNGCQTPFDRVVAQGAFDLVQQQGLDPSERIISYVLSGKEPVHQYGAILRSALTTWDLTAHALFVPEQIHLAHAVILVGGWDGTARAANWARIDKKPLLPVTAFKGAAAKVYEEELKRFDSVYAERIERVRYEMLNQISSDWKKVAKDVVSLAERIISSKYVLAIMSYSGDSKLEDAYDSFRDVCKEFQYECERISDKNAVDRIVPEIFASIKKSAFVVVDLTEARPNVYYELGYAQGLNKPVVVTAYKGTDLHFDVKDIPAIFWEGQKQLKERLRERIAEIASKHGR
ncbi:MAG TPA: hypothetical protein VI837_14705 [Blastocatellia bacterium]|nr:hypothetical protein [Blastocatellia bacterium]